MQKLPVIALVLLGGLLMAVFSSFFIVDQTEQALVLQFGRPIAVYRAPGLKFKLPMVQNVVFFDNRLLDFNARQPREVTTSDNKRLIVDWFVRYRITDPLKFYQAFKTEGNMQTQLNSILESTLGQVVGKVPMATLLSKDRVQVMHDIRTLVNRQAQGIPSVIQTEPGKAPAALPVAIPGGFGIEIADVRIKRTDLPPANSEAVFRRMRTEREKEAAMIRAVGAEEALKIKAKADRDRVVMLAQAQQQSETLRGEGDAEATHLAGLAFGQDKEFFDFYRTMQAYRKTLNPKDTRMVLSPDSGFLKDLNQP